MGLDVELLAKLVSKRPALYDHNLHDHANKRLVDRLWEEVGLEINASALECKTKWLCMRAFYNRILRQTNFGQNPKKRKWYLMDAMSFLFDSIYKKKKMEDKVERVLVAESKMINDTTDIDYEYKGNFTEVKPAAESSAIYWRKGQATSSPDQEVSMESSSSAKGGDGSWEANDGNTRFFKSLIPDVNKLSAKRQREFKEMVFCNLNRLLDEEESSQ